MKIRNGHHRRFPHSAEAAGARLDTLATAGDALWPHERWPRMVFDGGLAVGAKGGHGPIRYIVEEYQPGQRVTFRFSGPKGFDGTHRFVVAPLEGGCEVGHTLEMSTSGAALFSWPLLFQPLHDALIEDCLDKLEADLSGKVWQYRPWSRYVAVLRAVLARRRRRLAGGER